MHRTPKTGASKTQRTADDSGTPQSDVVLLHLSDLHFGAAHRFPIGDAQQHKALGIRFGRALHAAAKDLRVSMEQALVLVTGDITNAADPDEFKIAAEVLLALAGELGIATHRFVTCPGNHDINWDDCQIAEATARKEKVPAPAARSELDRRKLDEYRRFLKLLHGDSVDATVRPLPREARRQDFEDLKVSVIALNACERESHHKEDHLGFVSTEQSQADLDSWNNDTREGWIRVLSVHHNPDRAGPDNLLEIETWLAGQSELNKGSAERIIADMAGFEGREGVRRAALDARVSLLLHGHQHESDVRSWKWPKDGETLLLASGSAGADKAHLPGQQPNQVRLIAIDPRKRRIRIRTLTWEPRARQAGSTTPGDFVLGTGEHDHHDGPVYVPSKYAATGASRQRPTVTVSHSRVHEFLETYRKRLSARWADWELKGMAAVGAMGKPVTAGLDEMYQPLRLGPEKSPNKEAARGGASAKPMDAEALLSGPRALLIRGPAGAGKTTWMRYSFRRLLDHPGAVPFMLLVRDVALRWSQPGCSGEERSLDACLRADVGAYMGAGWDQNLFRRVLTADDGPVPVLLVDGWDELGDHGQKLREMLLGFMQAHPRLRVVVSTRPWGDGVPDGAQGFEVLEVQPLSDGEVDSFTRRFFRVCYALDEAAADVEVAKFLTALRASSEAKALASTALFLTMMLVVSRNKPLPDKRHHLYQECLTTLLKDRPDTWKREGVQRSPDWFRPDGGEQRWKAVARLALELQSKGYDGEQRRAVVAREDDLVAALPPNWNTDERRGFVRWLVGEAALLTDRADGTYTFAHLSFQEYLSARQLKASVAGGSSASPVLERLGKGSWWETLLLYAAEVGSENDDRVDTIVDALIGQGDAGLSLAGMILADGTGTSECAERWTRAWVAALEWGPEPQSSFRCHSAWAASQQAGRKRLLAEALDGAAGPARWRNWERLSASSASATRARVRPPDHGLAKLAYAYRSSRNDLGPAEVGVGRVLLSRGVREFDRQRDKLTPADTVSWLLMQWPSRRRRLAGRLQSALLAGAPHEAVLQIARDTRQAMTRRTNQRDRERILREIWPQIQDSPRYPRRSPRQLGPWERGLGSRLIGFWSELTRVYLPSSSRAVDYELRVFLEEAIAHVQGPGPEWVWRISDIGRSGFAEYLARGFLHRCAFSGPWVYDLLCLEVAGFASWAGPFLLLGGDPATPQEVILTDSLEEYVGMQWPRRRDAPPSGRRGKRGPPEPLHPVWLALASHLAGRSSEQERALLTDLAAHPEQVEPPLSWALQYVVRGDLVLDDGRTVALDDFLSGTRLAPLPFLDDPEPVDIPLRDDHPEPPLGLAG